MRSCSEGLGDYRHQGRGRLRTRRASVAQPRGHCPTNTMQTLGLRSAAEDGDRQLAVFEALRFPDAPSESWTAGRQNGGVAPRKRSNRAEGTPTSHHSSCRGSCIRGSCITMREPLAGPTDRAPMSLPWRTRMGARPRFPRLPSGRIV